MASDTAMNSSLLQAQFEARLESALLPPAGPESIVYKAARYSLLSGGKRLRPLLLLVTAKEISNGDERVMERAFTAALAVEMIHTYSLIHDDLPGMDNDDLRRGKPTLHKVYPEGQALLAGDLLLTSAFEHLAFADNFSAEEKIQLIQTLAKLSGGSGMIGGQAIDLAGEVQGKAGLDRLHQMKTGALIQASVMMGALAAGSSKSVLETLSRFAAHIGLAFQIVDDVLDVTHPEEKHGKASDSENGKTTYVSLLGQKKAEQTATELLHIAIKELETLNYNFVELKQVAKALVYREN